MKFKGPIPSVKKLSLCQEPKCDNPKTLILLLKAWNFICNRGTGHQICQVELHFPTCACAYSQEKMCPFHLYS